MSITTFSWQQSPKEKHYIAIPSISSPPVWRKPLVLILNYSENFLYLRPFWHSKQEISNSFYSIKDGSMHHTIYIIHHALWSIEKRFKRNSYIVSIIYYFKQFLQYFSVYYISISENSYQEMKFYVDQNEIWSMYSKRTSMFLLKKHWHTTLLHS